MRSQEYKLGHAIRRFNRAKRDFIKASLHYKQKAFMRALSQMRYIELYKE